jgi:hypothetical protein
MFQTTNQSINEGVVRCEHHGMNSGEFYRQARKTMTPEGTGFQLGTLKTNVATNF